MSDVYRDLGNSPEAIVAIFARLGLAGAAERPRVTPLTGGVSSGIFKVDLVSGSFCLKQALPLLKVAKEWKVPVERVFAEIDWLKTVEKIAPGHVPHVIGQDDATKSFVMEYLGDAYVTWKSNLLQGHIDDDIAAAVGDVIGRIHASTAHASDIAKRFATDANFYAIRLEPYLAETGRMHPTLMAHMQRLIETTQKHRVALVHGDLSPKNILIGPTGPILIDAECAWFGDPAFDLAFCLNHFVLKAAHRPQWVDKYMSLYSALVAAYFPHVTFESKLGLEGRIARLLPALALARVDGKSPAEYLEDAGRQRLRRAALGLLQEPAEDLASVRNFFIKEFSA